MEEIVEKESKYFRGVDTSLLDNKYLKYYVEWYVKSGKKEDYKKWGTLSDDYDFGVANYLPRGDVQKCIIDYIKRNKEINLIKVYNIMLNNAMLGDVPSANWIQTFSKSDFFQNKASELQDIIEGLSTDE